MKTEILSDSGDTNFEVGYHISNSGEYKRSLITLESILEKKPEIESTFVGNDFYIV